MQSYIIRENVWNRSRTDVAGFRPHTRTGLFTMSFISKGERFVSMLQLMIDSKR